ncbi:MAG: hypothetical protein D6737_18170 [Chloroflexi bacterium]|nr:MAG: hypothetical protein D6737_18170 [Chloroflexota bacterium]
MRTSISRQEWRRVIIYALVLMILTSLPYLIGWLTTPDGRTFTGFVLGIDDGNSYIGKMRLGARGLWQFHLFYSPEAPQSAPLIFLPYIIPGQLAGLFSSAESESLYSTLVIIFHIMRVVFGFVMTLVIYRFIAIFLRGPKTRFFALILATLGGGLGWLLLVLGQDNFLGSAPPEFFIPEGFTFLILLTLPHVALARAAWLGGLIALFEAETRDDWRRYAVIAGVLWLIVGLAVPFYLVILYIVLGAWGLALWTRARKFPMQFAIRGISATLITLPLAIYYAITFSSNDAFAQWSAQNLLPSPHPIHYLLAYGLFALLAIPGGRWAWRRGNLVSSHHTLLVGWVLIVPILVYLPINVQRRMAEGVLVPLAILAAAGARLLAVQWSKPNRRTQWRRIRVITFAIVLPSSLLILAGSTLTTLTAKPPLFRPTAEVRAFAWLNQHAQPGEVVLSTKETGNVIPAWTNLRVYVGHGPETLFSDQREPQADRFFAGELSAEEREAMLNESGVDYIFYGPAERALSDANLALLNDYDLIYNQGDYQIYTVRP